MIFLFILTCVSANHGGNETDLINALLINEKQYPIEMFDPVAVLKGAINGKQNGPLLTLV